MEFRVRFGVREWLFIGVAGFLLIGLTSALISRQRDKSKRADDAVTAYLQTCQAESSAEQCNARIEANHEECFLGTFHPGAKFSPAYFDGAGYERCVTAGFSVWQAEKRAANKAKEAERRSLGLP